MKPGSTLNLSAAVGLCLAAAAVASVLWANHRGDTADRTADADRAVVDADVVAAPPQPKKHHRCTFVVGEQLAWKVVAKHRAQIDIGALLTGPTTVPGGHVHADPAQDFTLDSRWTLRATVVGVTPGASAVLAAQIVDRALSIKGTITAANEGDVDPTFLIRVGSHCGIEAFAWHDKADLHGAQTQQALVSQLMWRLPKPGSGSKGPVSGRDPLGVWSGECAVGRRERRAVVQLRKRGYAKVFGDEAGKPPTEVALAGRGTTVTASASGWFQELTLQQRQVMRRRGVVFSRVSVDLRAEAHPATGPGLDADPKAPQWSWGDLYGRSLRRPQLQRLEEVASLKGLSTAHALAEFDRLMADPSANMTAYVNFLRDWIRANPDKLPELLAVLKAQRSRSRSGRLRRGAMFLALGGAQTDASRAALEGIFADPNWSAADRVQAALVSTGDPQMPQSFMDKLIATSRLHDPDDPYVNQGATALLGAVVAEQKGQQPKLVQQARAELIQRLGDQRDAQTLKDAIIGGGNAAEDAMWPHLKPHADHPDASVRKEVASALRLMSPATTSETFGAWLAKEPDAEVRRALIHAVWSQSLHSEQPPTEPVVVSSAAALNAEKDPETAHELVALLGMAAKGQAANPTAVAALQRRFKAEMAKGADKDFALLRLIGTFLKARQLL